VSEANGWGTDRARRRTPGSHRAPGWHHAPGRAGSTRRDHDALMNPSRGLRPARRHEPQIVWRSRPTGRAMCFARANKFAHATLKKLIETRLPPLWSAQRTLRVAAPPSLRRGARPPLADPFVAEPVRLRRIPSSLSRPHASAPLRSAEAWHPILRRFVASSLRRFSRL